MFCPKCGVELGRRKGALYCPAGDMPMSEVVEHRLTAIFVDRVEQPDYPPSERRMGGQWWCPGDGAQMVEEAGHVTCPNCGRELPTEVVYQLIKLHPHSPPET